MDWLFWITVGAAATVATELFVLVACFLVCCRSAERLCEPSDWTHSIEDDPEAWPTIAEAPSYSPRKGS